MNEIKQGNNAFYIGDRKKPLAIITFVPDKQNNNNIIVKHTYVSEDLRGQGIAFKLLQKVAGYARDNRKKIIPECPYVKKVMEEDSSFSDLLFNHSNNV
jgi:predicted GNAT family acetyltransferase